MKVLEVKCSDKDCNERFQTTEPLHPEAKYTCRLHTPKKASAEPPPSFQRHQFDPNIARRIASDFPAPPEGGYHEEAYISEFFETEESVRCKHCGSLQTEESVSCPCGDE